MASLEEKQANFKWKGKKRKKRKMPQETRDKIGRSNRLFANKKKQETMVEDKKKEVKDFYKRDVREELADFLGLPK